MNVYWGFEDPKSWVPICRSVCKTDVFQYAGKQEAVIPGLELTIPSVQAGTQILLQGSINITADKQYSYLRLYRDDQAIAMGDAAGTRTRVTLSAITANYSNDKYLQYGGGFTYLDTVPQMGDVRYTIRVGNSYYATAVTFINRAADDADGSYSHRGVSTLTAITLRNNDITTAGPPGPLGPRGAIGPQGPTGTSGQRGEAGPRGDTGALGPQGKEGTRGQAGEKGPKGDVGAFGPQGKEGPRGQTGGVGPIGEKGDTGPTGAHGRKGDTGPIGPQGQEGDVGSTGPAGQRGPKGGRGPAGEIGHVGAIGPRGLSGPQGPQGPSGPVGPALDVLCKYLPIEFAKEYERNSALLLYEYRDAKSVVVSGSHIKKLVRQGRPNGLDLDMKIDHRHDGAILTDDRGTKVFKFYNDLYWLHYRIDSTPYVMLSFVYNIGAYSGAGDEYNYLFSTGATEQAHSGLCFPKNKNSIRVYGADGGTGVYYRDIAKFRDFYIPSKAGLWNVVTVSYSIKSGKADSGVWINREGKVLAFKTNSTFKASTFCVGNRLVVFTGASGFKGLIAYIAVYPSFHPIADSVCQALTFALADKYKVRELMPSAVKKTAEIELERGAWEVIDHGLNT